MIPFASQRGLGQDLATHLLNVQENEYAEIEGLRGAIAGDLHGAFAEWEAQAHALTKCKNYLYSMSINPDPAQGELSREQYLDYIARAEEKLGLENQPRAVVFHIKEGREHCHVIWSRIDTDNEKAVHMAFDRDKLMMVTRQFAKDHNLELPAGYHSKEGSKNKQLSLYEMHQKRSTGISKEEHMEVVTDAWRQSDSAKAFVQALAQRGYILATGKRPYVLVDFYGHTNSLPKLINDKSVRTKDIRAFLKNEYPAESLPSVDEAKALVSEHRKNIETFAKDDQKKEEIIVLKRRQEQRRQKLEVQQSTLRKSQHKDRLVLAKTHKAERNNIRGAHIAETKSIKAERYKNRPTGLAAFLGRVSGVELLRGALHKYQDWKRIKAYVLERQELKQTQKEQQGELQRRHALQALDLSRKEKALHKIEIREIKSLDEGIKKEARIAARGGENRMPSIPLDRTKSKTVTLASDMDHREKYEMQLQLEDEFEQAAEGKTKHKQIDLKTDFTRAAKGQDENKDRGSSEGPKPAEENKVKRYKRTRKCDLDNDRGR
jgi:relaxase-like protein